MKSELQVTRNKKEKKETAVLQDGMNLNLAWK